MTTDWQNLAALALVAAAVLYLGRQSRRWFARRRSGGCGSCGTCPTEAATSDDSRLANGRPLVSLDSLAKIARKE